MASTQNSLSDATDRFMLEEAIVACFNVSEDLNLIVEEILEGNADPDELANMLQGAADLHKLRCEKTFRIFSQLIETRKLI